MWLNLYGREAVRHMLKNGLKTRKMHFLPVLGLMSDSLTAIKVKPHRCPSQQSILLTQRPIQKFFKKKYWELAILKNVIFLSRPFWIFFSKKMFFFCFIPIKISPNLYGRMDGSKFWCFTWFSENSLLCVILRYTVYKNNWNFFVSRDCHGLWWKGLKKVLLDLNSGRLVWV